MNLLVKDCRLRETLKTRKDTPQEARGPATTGRATTSKTMKKAVKTTVVVSVKS